MTVAVVILALVVVALLALLLLRHHAAQGKSAVPVALASGQPSRILFPYRGNGPSSDALDVALRLARAESATLVPVFLARVTMDLPLDAALPKQSQLCVPLQETIEQRAAAAGVPVDSRVERGRSFRHALRQTIENERFDRLVISAAAGVHGGFDSEDVAWLLRNAPGEILVLRPALDSMAAADSPSASATTS